MNDASVLGLIQNVALLLAVAFLFDLAAVRWRAGQSAFHQALVGFALGGVGITVMLTPWTFMPGIVFDTRSVLIAVSGLFFGSLSAFMAMAMTAAFRYYLGGEGAWTGMAVILASGAIGIAWRHFRSSNLAEISLRELYLFGMVVHSAMLALMLTLPWEKALQVLSTITLPVLLVYPVGTALLGMLMASRLRRERSEDALIRSEQLLKDTQSLSKVGGWEYDVKKRRLIWTEEVYRIYALEANIDPDSEIAKATNFYPEAAWKVLKRAFLNAVQAGQPYDLELRFRAADGTQKWVRTIGTPVFQDEQVVRVVGNIMDITQTKQAEEEIRLLNEELEERVRQRTAQLEAVNEELESFSYSVSHDLRAPLRAIDGFSEIILEDYADRPLDDEGKACLARIRKATHRMGHLIDDLLKLSHVSRSGVKNVSVDLSRIVQAFIDLRRQDHPGTVVDTVVQEGVIVNGDHYLLEIAMGHLLDNAWKFTCKKDRPRVEFGSLRQDGDIVCYIRDNGAGFDTQYVDKLFQAFQRLHSSEVYPGTGIGLATVKRIINRHGGRIWAEGEIGRGATFYFTIPWSDHSRSRHHGPGEDALRDNETLR